MDKYLYVLVEHHARSAKTYKHELASKRSDERKLVESSIQMHQSISGEEKNREKIRKLRNAEQAKLKSTVNQKAIYQRSIAEMEKRERLIQSLITKLERENRVPPFYFEIRHRGKPQDPLEWISRYKKGS